MPGTDELIAVIDADGARLVELATSAPDTPVPTCGDWSAEKLLRHVAGLHGWARECVARGPAEVHERVVPPKGPELRPFAEGALHELVETLRGADPDATVHTWAGPRPVRWWARRLAHETCVHRIDAEQALGVPEHDIPPALAIDGINEVLDVFLPLRFRRDEFGGEGGTVHLHATDPGAAGEWLIDLGHPVTVRREHAKGDVAVRGPAHDLHLVLWHRRPVDALEVFGDDQLLRRFLQGTTF